MFLRSREIHQGFGGVGLLPAAGPLLGGCGALVFLPPWRGKGPREKPATVPVRLNIPRFRHPVKVPEPALPCRSRGKWLY